MPTLLDLLQQKLQGPSLDAASGQAAGITAAKSGKDTGAGVPGAPAGTAGAPAASNLGAAQTAAQTTAAGQVQQVAGQQTAQALQTQQTGIIEKGQQAQAQTTQQLSNVQQDAANRASTILANLQQGQEKLSADQFREQSETAAFNIRLSSQEYVSNLQRAGQQSLLQNENNFQEEYYKSVFADSTGTLISQTALKQIADSTDRQFQQQLATIDINFAIKLATMSRTQANAGQIATGAGAVISGGSQFAANQGWFTPSAPISPEPGQRGATSTVNAPSGNTISTSSIDYTDSNP